MRRETQRRGSVFRVGVSVSRRSLELEIGLNSGNKHKGSLVLIGGGSPATRLPAGRHEASTAAYTTKRGKRRRWWENGDGERRRIGTETRRK